MRKLLVLPALALLMMAAPAMAMQEMGEGGGHPDPRAAFQQADKNGDGALDKSEFVALSAQRAEMMFNMMDQNHDGKLTPDEMRPQQRRGGMGGGMGGGNGEEPPAPPAGGAQGME